MPYSKDWKESKMNIEYLPFDRILCDVTIGTIRSIQHYEKKEVIMKTNRVHNLIKEAASLKRRSVCTSNKCHENNLSLLVTISDTFKYMHLFVPPQSNIPEKIIKFHSGIGKRFNDVSGDGIKNGCHYEIKTSLHDKNGNCNIRQIRPDHDIDTYTVGYYNFKKDFACLMNIPARVIYDMVLSMPCLTHGTRSKYINKPLKTISDLKGCGWEFSITTNPYSREGTKKKMQWDILYRYNVSSWKHV